MTRKHAIVPIIAFLAAATEGLIHYQKPKYAPKSSTSRDSNRLRMRLNPTSFKNSDYIITEFPRPALRRVPNAPIATFDPAFVAKTKEMMEIMYQAKGVGLAAPQIGLNENLFVYNPSADRACDDMERVVCNPTITKYAEETYVEKEGCLSLRSDACAGQVARSVWIEVEYQNELSQEVRRRLKGFEARVFQHEYDHLNGILCYDRFPPEDREAVRENVQKLMELYSEDDGITHPDEARRKAMRPRPLDSRWMPPLESKSAEVEEKPKLSRGGFGAGPVVKKAGKKKEKKKKIKPRNGAFSSNPTFK